MGHQHNRIIFLAVPNSFPANIGDNFSIDPAIPIPVEISDGTDKPNLESLSWEMIISGMLIVIKEGNENREWIDYYRQFVLALRPNILDILANAAAVKEQNGENELARELFDILQAFAPSPPENAFNDENFIEAYELINEGNAEAGMEIIHSYLKKNPSAWNGWFVLGWALRQTGRWEDGANAIAKAIDLGAGGSDIYNELAICLMEAGDLKGARQYLEKALQEDSENVKIISNLGVLALRNNNHSEAAEFFRAVLEIDPEDAIASNFFKG